MENILVFGGKGGVGKSSISAATAVYLSYALKNKKILLVSFDIAHNLSDLFDKSIGNDITQITENLFAIEPDPDIYAENYTQKLTSKTRELFKSSLMMNLIPELEDIIEEAIQSENIPLAMKNSLFFQSILDAENPMADIGEERMTYRALGQSPKTPYSERPTIPVFDIIVCDFPPTGNMLALFEVPADSTRRLMKLSLKTSASVTKHLNQIKKIGKMFKPATWLAKNMIQKQNPSTEPKLDKEEKRNLAQDILDILHEMEQRSKRISILMKEVGSLRIVSIPEKPSFEEAKRARELSKKYIAVDGLHINRLIPLNQQGKSEYLDKLIQNQEIYRKLLHSYFSKQRIWDSELLKDPPVGIDGLYQLALEIYNSTTIEDILNPLQREIIVPEMEKKENPFKINKE